MLPKTVTWPAKPHTIAKIKLLEEYLYLWFMILGRSRPGQRLLYVDGFCGPGEYTNHPTGSPVAAIQAARNAMANAGEDWRAGTVHCAFIDEDPKRMEHLKQKVGPDDSGGRISVSYHPRHFDEGVEEVRQQFPEAFEGKTPLFVFIDPFGAKGAPFELVAHLLSSETSEVLINLDGDGIARIMEAGDAAGSENAAKSIFGVDNPLPSLAPHQPFGEKCRQVLHHYKQGLRQYADYVFSFEMRSGRTDALQYYLVFASKHKLGLVKMKEAMQSIDQSREYVFREADEHQARLFRFDQPEEWMDKMFGIWTGRRVEWRELERDILNETPFINASALLKPMDKEGYVAEIETVPGAKRRRGDFTERSVAAVRFVREHIPPSFGW